MATLMVVEDDKNQRLLYEQELTEEGYDVILVEGGREALEKLEKVTPDLVILDISMPGMDGIETLGKILGRERSISIVPGSAGVSRAASAASMTIACRRYLASDSGVTIPSRPSTTRTTGS